jgi:hypothetical protein
MDSNEVPPRARTHLGPDVQLRMLGSRKIHSKALIDELLQTIFYRFQSLVSVHSFCPDCYLSSFADVRRHNVHDADRRTSFSVCFNRDFAFEAHRTAHQFAYRARMKTTLVRNQYPPCCRFFCSVLHRYCALYVFWTPHAGIRLKNRTCRKVARRFETESF